MASETEACEPAASETEVVATNNNKRHRQSRRNSTDPRFAIPRSIFRTITREILAKRHVRIKLFDRKSLVAMQFEAEQFVSDLFQLSSELSTLSGHFTVDLPSLKAAIAIYHRYKTTHA